MVKQEGLGQLEQNTETLCEQIGALLLNTNPLELQGPTSSLACSAWEQCTCPGSALGKKVFQDTTMHTCTICGLRWGWVRRVLCRIQVQPASSLNIKLCWAKASIGMLYAFLYSTQTYCAIITDTDRKSTFCLSLFTYILIYIYFFLNKTMQNICLTKTFTKLSLKAYLHSKKSLLHGIQYKEHKLYIKLFIGWQVVW